MPSATFDKIDLGRLNRLAAGMTKVFSPELVIGLVGTLGAGKTTFTQALASAAGVNPEDVTSPTFTLLCSYDARIAKGPIRLHHLDAYRIADEDEFLELGVDELFESNDAWVLIEWADRVKSVLPPQALWVTIDIVETDPQEIPKRVITMSTDDPGHSNSINTLVEMMCDTD